MIFPSARSLAGAGALAVSLSLSQTALGQTLGGGAGDVEISWWRLILGTTVCVVLAVAGGVALKAKNQGVSWQLALPALLRKGPRPRRRLMPLESFRVNPQTEVCLFQFDSREYLIAVTGSHIAVLDTRDAPAPEPSE